MCGQEALRVIADGVADVVVDEVGVEGDGGRGAGAGGGDDLGAGVDDVAGGPDSRDAGAAGGVGGDPAVVVDVAAEADEQAVVRDEAGRHEQRVAGHDAAVAHLHAAQLVVVDDQLLDGAFDDADGAGDQLVPLDGGEDVGRGEVDEVVGPLADDLGVPDGARSAADDAELAVADLVAVAVRGSAGRRGPTVAQPGMSGSSSRRPVVTSSRRAEIRCPSASRTQNPSRPSGTRSVAVPATISPP